MGDPLPLLQDSLQPVSDCVEVGEELPEERSESVGREDTVEIEETLIDMIVMIWWWGLRREDGGMELFVSGESGLCMFQIPFWDPGVFFSRIPFPSNQE